MIEREYIELMNKEIDGANSPAESDALRSYLASHAEAQAYYEDLQSIARKFSEASDVRPPAGLEDRVLSAIVAREQARDERHESGSSFFRPRRKLAYAFAAGLAIGLLGFAVVFHVLSGSSRLNVQDLYGTFAEREKAGNVIVSKSAAIEADGLAGTASVEYRDAALVVNLAINARDSVEIEIAPQAKLVLESFRAPECGRYEIRTSGSNIMAYLQGKCGIIVAFRDLRQEHPPVSIRATSNGTMLFDETITATRK